MERSEKPAKMRGWALKSWNSIAKARKVVRLPVGHSVALKEMMAEEGAKARTWRTLHTSPNSSEVYLKASGVTGILTRETSRSY